MSKKKTEAKVATKPVAAKPVAATPVGNADNKTLPAKASVTKIEPKPADPAKPAPAGKGEVINEVVDAAKNAVVVKDAPKPAKDRGLPHVRVTNGQSLIVPLKFIQAALLVAAQHDVRYYLNGVYFHAKDAELRVCATDGHRLVVSRFTFDEKIKMPKWAVDGVILPREELTQALPILLKNAGLTNTAYVGATEPSVVIEQAGEGTIVLRTMAPFANFVVTPVDGKFPDYDRILGNTGELLARGEGEVMETSSIDARFIKGAADIANKLGAKSIHSFIGSGDHAALFTFGSAAPDTVLIIMPMRDGASVSPSAIKLLGSNAVNASIAALRAHKTRALTLLKEAKGGDREHLQEKVDSFDVRIQALLDAAKDGPKRIEKKEAA